jgi:hypothetical protein
MKAWIWVGIALATILLGYTMWAMFIKKDAEDSEDFQGGGWGFTPVTRRAQRHKGPSYSARRGGKYDWQPMKEGYKTYM